MIQWKKERRRERKKVKSLSCAWLFATPWSVACQAPLSMGFSRQEYWSGLPFPSPGALPDPGIEPGSPALQAGSLLPEPPGKSRWSNGCWSNGCWQFDLWFLCLFKSGLNISGSPWFMYCWSLAYRILSITCWRVRWVQFAVVWTFFGIAFLWIGMKTDIFQSCGHLWVFQICWHIECSTFTVSYFRVCTSSAGVPSHPLALSIVMLPKAHLTSHSRISGSGWVITPS